MHYGTYKITNATSVMLRNALRNVQNNECHLRNALRNVQNKECHFRNA